MMRIITRSCGRNTCFLVRSCALMEVPIALDSNRREVGCFESKVRLTGLKMHAKFQCDWNSAEKREEK